MRRRPSTFIEFIGLPGAGKTTVAAALVERLDGCVGGEVAMPERDEYRRPQLEVADKARLDIAYATAFLGYRLKRLLFDVRCKGPGLWTVRQSWKQSRYPIVLLDRARRQPHRFYILDEWLVHRTIDESIRRYHGSSEFCRRFAIPRVAPHSLLYVFLWIDPKVARERILEQEHPYRDFAKRKDVQEIDRVLGLWDRQLRLMRGEIGARAIPCVDLDGDNGVERNASLIEKRLLEPAAPKHHLSRERACP
jgi:thymidylate kinase